tara:strand:- start:16898 stop:17578 length:681 start_codon:yes stop_codon:yes gene_type:complete
MNAVTDIKADHKYIAQALAAAQMKMGKALKSASNPHFKKNYADLASVCDACMPALNEAGIAVIQPTTDDESGRYVETILIHGESGQELKCRVPLIVQKNDMQGYGSAVTYARRYGLMSMAGIAPEDDDGNAAANSAPVIEKAKPAPQRDPEALADGMIAAINGADTEARLKGIWTGQKFKTDLDWLRGQSPEKAAHVEAAKDSRKESLKPQANHDLDDELPEFEDA